MLMHAWVKRLLALKHPLCNTQQFTHQCYYHQHLWLTRIFSVAIEQALHKWCIHTFSHLPKSIHHRWYIQFGRLGRGTKPSTHAKHQTNFSQPPPPASRECPALLSVHVCCILDCIAICLRNLATKNPNIQRAGFHSSAQPEKFCFITSWP